MCLTGYAQMKALPNPVNKMTARCMSDAVHNDWDDSGDDESMVL